MRASIRAAAFVAALVTLPFIAWAEDSYKDRTLALFAEFLEMKRDGVFMPPQTLKLYQDAGLKFPNRIRGDNPPGGFFARPPGSVWLAKVEALRDEGKPGDLENQCFDIPKDLSGGDVICGFELILFVGAAIDEDTELDNLTRRFWLGKICHEAPAACARNGD